jgi:hypothetical protein
VIPVRGGAIGNAPLMTGKSSDVERYSLVSSANCQPAVPTALFI